MKKLFSTLSRNILVTINKSFVKSNINYAGITYQKSLNESFKKKFETVE